MIRNNQTQRILRSAGFCVGLVLMAVPAVMTYMPAARAQEQRVCAVATGLDQSGVGYGACIRILDRYQAAAQQQGYEAAACRYVDVRATAACAFDFRATLWNVEDIAAR
jgi:hypothetical protein